MFDDNVTNWLQNRSGTIDCETLHNKTVTATGTTVKGLKNSTGFRKHLPSSYHDVFFNNSVGSYPTGSNEHGGGINKSAYN